MDEVEKQAIADALQRTQGHVREAAVLLGISQATIYRKIKSYGLALPRNRSQAPAMPV